MFHWKERGILLRAFATSTGPNSHVKVVLATVLFACALNILFEHSIPNAMLKSVQVYFEASPFLEDSPFEDGFCFLNGEMRVWSRPAV